MNAELPKCKRPGCGQEECATIHMQMGGHDFVRSEPTAIIKVYATLTPGDAATVAQWVGEALANGDVRDSQRTYNIHSIEVEVQDL